MRVYTRFINSTRGCTSGGIYVQVLYLHACRVKVIRARCCCRLCYVFRALINSLVCCLKLQFRYGSLVFSCRQRSCIQLQTKVLFSVADQGPVFSCRPRPRSCFQLQTKVLLSVADRQKSCYQLQTDISPVISCRQT